MTTKIYINNYTKEIKTEIEINEMIKQAVQNIESEILFSDWLNDNYYIIEVWNMTDKERKAVEKKFENYIYNCAVQEIEDEGWEENV